MVQTCTRCSRPNPPEAAYCYFDGNLLHGHANGGPVQPGLQQFPTPFAFPSGLTCRNFDQLALACQQNWTAARGLMKQGVLEKFFGGLGRMDLAFAARTSANFPDLDRGLDQLLAKLPSRALAAPKLTVRPPLIDLGTVAPGRDQRFELRVANEGMRLLYGSVTSDCKWLVLGDGPGNPQKLFQCGGDTAVAVRVRGDQLRAGNKQQEGHLVVETNGGTLTVAVRAMVPVKPLGEGILAGSVSPRQVAEKAKANPKEAAALFEKGVVAQWYKDNGWSYPVQGPAASGVSAVQQFFEALGLTKPPRVELGEPSISLRGRGGECLEHRLQVRTQEKKPVYAHARSDQPWLAVGRTQFNGPVAIIPLQVQQVPDRPGEVLQARVVVLANGNQRFVVPVSLAVAGSGRSPLAPATLAATATAGSAAAPAGGRGDFAGLSLAEDGEPGSYRHSRRQQGRGRHLLPLLLLLLLLSGLTAYDFNYGPARQTAVAVRDEPPEERKVTKTLPGVPAVPVGPVKVDIQDEPEERGPEAQQPVKVAIQDEPEEGGAPVDAGPAVPIDPTPLVDYEYDLTNMRVGITALKVKDKAGGFAEKQLTFRKDGSTSNTRIKVDGEEYNLGPGSGSEAAGGIWEERAKEQPDDPKGLFRKRTVSVFKRRKFTITQTVEIVPSKQPVEIAPGVRKRQMDTVLVRYLIENNDKNAHRLGLRVMVDTLIGDNDGVPFTVPDLSGMVSTHADFNDAARAGKQIPDFVQALEQPDLQNPGTVAHMTLKLGGRMEPPNRVSLTHWPSSTAPWEVPLADIKDDSSVVIYWNEQLMEPNERREFGYAYGLGGVTSTEGAGKLGITLGGSFEPGQIFTVTTYVTNPISGQKLTLTLPEGLEVQGDARVPVPAGKGSPPTSIVTWKAKVLKTGEFRIRVDSSTGISQSKTITITPSTGGRFTLTLDGAIEPGKVFDVRATVTDPVPGQTLTLNVPPALERVGGKEVEPVPQPPGDNKAATSTVTWKVKVREAGKHAVRVVSSTGLVQTKTLTIDSEPGRFVIELAGDIDKGKDFTVLARVTNPLPGQRLTLHLPDKLKLQEGDATQAVPSTPPGMRDATTTVTWRVRVLDYGQLRVRIQSSTGVSRAKTITLSGPGTGQIFGK
jgi:hypothetical protein